jgi:S1-C subfamily serine protease
MEPGDPDIDKISSESTLSQPGHGAGPEDSADMRLLDALSRSIASIVEAVTPSVVSLIVHGVAHNSCHDIAGAGSGIVIAPDGYILTEWPINQPLIIKVIRRTEVHSFEVRPVEPAYAG